MRAKLISIVDYRQMSRNYTNQVFHESVTILHALNLCHPYAHPVNTNFIVTISLIGLIFAVLGEVAPPSFGNASTVVTSEHVISTMF